MPYTEDQEVRVKETALRASFTGRIASKPQISGARTFYLVKDASQKTHRIPEDALSATGIVAPSPRAQKQTAQAAPPAAIEATQLQSIPAIKETEKPSQAEPKSAAKTPPREASPAGARTTQFMCAGCGADTKLMKIAGPLQGRPPTKCTSCKENPNWVAAA